MEVKLVFIKELSQNIKILKLTKDELEKELSSFPSDIGEEAFKSLVLELFVPGISLLFDNILGRSNIVTSNKIVEIKELLYKTTLATNKLLNPCNLYITNNNCLSLIKQKVKLVETNSWLKKDDPLTLNFSDMSDYMVYSEEVATLEHTIEVEKCELLNFSVKIRVFNRQDKIKILMGLDPVSEDELKYYVVLACIDSLSHIYKHLSESSALTHIPFNKVIYALYALAIKYNSFLKISIKELAKINNSIKKEMNKASLEKDLFVLNKTSAPLTLKKLPKKIIENLETNILNNVFGQDETVKAICNSIKRAHLGLKLKTRPIGAYLFYGPTSTGKTELAKVLAAELTKSENNFIKIGCNSLQMDHTVHTLIGSPPSYVGYEDRGLLYKSFKSGGFKILLFDEIDKATPKLFDLLLEALEEGQILLADGSYINISESIVILTSNIGQQEANEALNFTGFESNTIRSKEKEKLLYEQYKKILFDTLKPELIARLNGIFFFKELNDSSLRQVARRHLNKYLTSLSNNKLKIEVNDQVYSYILESCSRGTTKLHARALRDFIDTKIIQELGEYLIANSLTLSKVRGLSIFMSETNLKFEVY